MSYYRKHFLGQSEETPKGVQTLDWVKFEKDSYNIYGEYLTSWLIALFWSRSK